MLYRYPWDEMGGKTPLSEAVAARMAAEKRIGAWNGVGAIAGTPSQVRAARQTIRRAFRGVADRVVFISDRRLQLIERYPRLISRLTGMNVPEMLKTVRGSFGIMKGVPSEVALSLAYWRNRRPPTPGDIHPARDNCGLLWFAPIIPMTRDDVAAFTAIAEPILARHRFECCLTLTAVNERCFDCTLPILYDKDDPVDTENAMSCHQALSTECGRDGFIPYRLGLQSMEHETAREDPFWRLVSTLKQAVDPAGILAPGRYAR
jgi:4-cresol dehydrogenase (hydroxylating)